MAAQSFLVQNLVLQQRSHPHLFHHHHHHHHHHRRHPPPPQLRPSQTCSSVNFKTIQTKTFKNLIVISSSLNNNNVNRRSNNGDSNQDINYKIKFPKLETKQNPKPAVETLINAVRALRKPAAAAAAVILLGLLLSVNPNTNHALAASGNSSSSYSSSTSLAAPPPSSPPSTYGVMNVLVVSLIFLVLVGAACALVDEVWCYINKKSVTVVKLQVGLLGLGRSLQKDINRIAEPVDVSTSEGLHNILTELVVALLRYPENCASAFLTIDQEWGSESAQQKFYQHSMEERIKFDEEKLVNVNNIKRQSPITTMASSGFSNDYIVLTILVKAQGVLQLPRIKNSNNLKEVLRKLAYLPISKILEVKIIWNPHIEDDTLSEEELIRNYPLLRSLQ